MHSCTNIEVKAVYKNTDGQLMLSLIIHDEYFLPQEETVVLNKKIKKRLKFNYLIIIIIYASSSTGQSNGLLSRRSQVRVLPGVLNYKNYETRTTRQTI